MTKRDTGNRGEHLAAEFLRRWGYTILETNFRCPGGEIDIVAKDKDCLVFVEVRSKHGQAFGTPEESITRAKKDKLRLTAFQYLDQHNCLNDSWRIDFVAVEMDGNDNAARIEIFENAVGEE